MGQRDTDVATVGTAYTSQGLKIGISERRVEIKIKPIGFENMACGYGIVVQALAPET